MANRPAFSEIVRSQSNAVGVLRSAAPLHTAPKAVYVVPAEADARWRLNAASQCVFLSIRDQDAQDLLRDFGVPHPRPIRPKGTPQVRHNRRNVGTFLVAGCDGLGG